LEEGRLPFGWPVRVIQGRRPGPGPGAAGLGGLCVGVVRDQGRGVVKRHHFGGLDAVELRHAHNNRGAEGVGGQINQGSRRKRWLGGNYEDG
jgi:hypothetical protein